MSAEQPRRPVPPTNPRADGPTLLLVGLMLMVSGLGLWAADWTDHLDIVPAMGVLGVVAGSVLAISRFSARTAAWFATVYGIFFAGWELGGVLEGEPIWRERILELLRRFLAFLAVVWRGEANPDLLMFVLLMAGLYWVIGVCAAWAAVRHRGLWRAALPAGLALTVNAFYSFGRSGLDGYLAGYVLLTLLLALRLHLVQRQEVWQTLRARVPPGTVANLLQVGLVTAGLLVLLAWGGPAYAQSDAAAKLWTDLSRPWARLRDRIGDAFGNLRGPVVHVSDFYGEDLVLDAGTEPGQEAVILVEPDPPGERLPRLYWRARVYDTYRDGLWSTAPVEQLSYSPEAGDWPVGVYQGRRAYAFRTTVLAPALHTLYLAAQPVWVGRTTLVNAVRQPDESIDVLSVATTPLVLAGETYRSRASLAVPTAEQLRAAGREYPSWVRKRYLQLPDTITPRTVELAQSIAGGLASPYDQALAITRWLRTHIRYSRDSPGPPPGAEPIDWFLFESRTGFCDYYASADVILLRALGVPSRLSAGLAEGSYNPGRGVYEAHAKDAHTWPEVFFPGFGWVEFEPTASQPPLIRPETAQGAGAAAGEAREAGEGKPFQPERFEQEFFPGQEPLSPGPEAAAPPNKASCGWLLAVLGAAAAALAIRLWKDPHLQVVVATGVAGRLRRLGLEPPASLAPRPLAAGSLTARTYLRWSLWFRRLGLPLNAVQTPYERATLFSTALPSGRQAAWSIVEQYVRERFGAHATDEKVVRESWGALEPQLWGAWLQARLARLRQARRMPPREGPPAARPRRV